MRQVPVGKIMDDYFFKNINIEGVSHLFVCKGHSRIAKAEKLKKRPYLRGNCMPTSTKWIIIF